MPRSIRRTGAFVLTLALSWAGVDARADEPAPTTAAKAIVVVDVAPDATEVDEARLRAAIGGELGADAVAPGDARAAHARGTITVSIDRTAQALVVSYREGEMPVTRRIALPGDPEAVSRAVVVLAGNLARDEGSELAAELRKSRRAEDAATSPGAGADTSPRTTAGAGIPPQSQAAIQTEDAEAVQDVDRMGRVLAYATGHDRTLRAVAGWSLFGLGLGAAGVGAYLTLTKQGGATPLILLLDAFPTLQAIGLELVPSAELDKIASYYERDRATGRAAPLVRRDLELLWRQAAHREHSMRRLFGWMGIVGGTLVLGLVAAAFVSELHQGPVPSHDVALDAILAGAGAVPLGYGIYAITTDGPVESALDAYERGSGRSVSPGGGGDVGLRISPVPGGGTLGVGGSF